MPFTNTTVDLAMAGMTRPDITKAGCRFNGYHVQARQVQPSLLQELMQGMGEQPRVHGPKLLVSNRALPRPATGPKRDRSQDVHWRMHPSSY
jgi:hypothetical protein